MPGFFKKSDGGGASSKSRPLSTGGVNRNGDNNGAAPPPSYNEAASDQPIADGRPPPGMTPEDLAGVNVAAAFEKLDLSTTPGHPTVDTCLAHLKLLFAIQTMKEDVGYTDGLWDLWDIRAGPLNEPLHGANPTDSKRPEQTADDKKLEVLSKLREKRWALFVARAVDRYEAWWKSMPQNPLTEQEMKAENSVAYALFPFTSTGLFPWSEKNLPPLDVLMVFHSHMLNPRDYLEDTMLAGFHSLWAAGMPWAFVNRAIDTRFAYHVSDECKATWVAQTGRPWENTDDAIVKTLRCPGCNETVQIPWTTCGLPEDYAGDDRPGIVGNGYGDGNLLFLCPSCGIAVDKHLLSVSKFCKDTESLLARGRTMPGTLLDPKTGLPEAIPSNEILQAMYPRTFPNRVLQRALRIQVVELIKPGMRPNPTMLDIKNMIEGVFADNEKIKSVDSFRGVRRYAPSITARICVRKMMSRYWENFGTFALDLGGAVMRQGIFAEKMAKIDWLHSPSAPQTMGRLLTKYERFLSIMAAHPTKVAVPTLDVDLAWHTHQLSPFSYFDYTVKKTKRFIDHDDKIDEDKLSESFQWTSKVYQEKYSEVYSECTCWYCECKHPPPPLHSLPRFESSPLLSSEFPPFDECYAHFVFAASLAVRSSHVSSVGKVLGISQQDKGT